MANPEKSEAPPSQLPPAVIESSQRRSKLSLSKKLLFSLVAFALFFGVLELLLAAAGVRRMKYEEDPYVGFTSRIPLFVESPGDPGVMVTAANKQSWFNTQSFPKQKPPSAYRIFCVGGSTTFGRPYDDATSYCGWLREFLGRADPSHPWEVINAGGISYASYRVALMMEELVQYEPDLFIIYSGHNEFLERRTYESVIETPAAVRGLGAVLSGTRTFSALHRVIHAPKKRAATELASEVDTILDGSVGLDGYKRDSTLQRQVLDHYRYNLLRMVDIARSAGAKVILVTPASNLRDCAPFKSEHRALLGENELRQWQSLMERAEADFADQQFEKALSALEQAAAIDNRYAHLHYLHGRVLDRLGRHSEAKTAFQRARDEDVCPLRALTPMQEIVNEVAVERDVPLIDYRNILETLSPQEIPGENVFLDHVHPTIEGHRILGLALLDELEAEDVVTPGERWNAEAISDVTEAVESRIDSKVHGRALLNLSQVLSWAGKHEESGKLALQAVEMIPDNSEAHFLAGCEFARRDDLDQARSHLERSLQLDPNPRVAFRAYDNLGLVFVRQGDLNQAEEQFLKAAEIDPRSARIYNNLGLVAGQKGDLPQAIQYFERAVSVEPGFAMGHFNLAMAYAQQGDNDLSRRHLERVLQIQPSYPGAREALARLDGSRP